MSRIIPRPLRFLTRLRNSARSAAQKTAQSVLSHPLAKPILRNIPDPIVQFANAPPAELTRLQETAGVGVRSIPFHSSPSDSDFPD